MFFRCVQAWYSPYVQSMITGCSDAKCTESCDSLELPALEILDNAQLAGPVRITANRSLAA